MKITLSQLKRIIKEEVQHSLRENDDVTVIDNKTNGTVGGLISELQELVDKGTVSADMPVHFGDDSPYQVVGELLILELDKDGHSVEPGDESDEITEVLCIRS